MLAYDPASNEVESIPVWGMAGDLSQAEDASARELSNMVPHDSTEGVRRLDRLREQRSESGKEGAEESDAEECTAEAPHEEHMDHGYKGGSDEVRATALSMVHAPQHLARAVCTPHTITSQDTAPAASAGQTSACPGMKVTMCWGMRRMPPA